VIALSLEAEARVDQLIEHYESRRRLEAAVNLLKALERASTRIVTSPEAGLLAPLPYPA
jgi:plasmid stabilization system protein ParE